MSPFQPNRASDTWSLSGQFLGSHTTVVDSSTYNHFPPSQSWTIVTTEDNRQLSGQRPQAIRRNNPEYQQEQLLYGIGAWVGSHPVYPPQQRPTYAQPKYAPTSSPPINPRISLRYTISPNPTELRSHSPQQAETHADGAIPCRNVLRANFLHGEPSRSRADERRLYERECGRCQTQVIAATR